MDSNRISMVSFVWQAAGLAVMLAMPNSVVALHVGSIIVGLSVGTSFLCHRWLSNMSLRRSFGLLVGLNATVGTLIMAVGPGLFGLAHDLSGAMPLLFACASACRSAGCS